LAEGKDRGKTVQMVRNSPEGVALANGFEQSLREQGQPPVKTISLPTGMVVTQNFIKQLLEKEKPDTILLWDGLDSLRILDLLASFQNRPHTVFVSARYLANNLQSIPERARDFTLITYPYSFARRAVPSTMGGSIMVEDDSKWRINLSKQTEHDSISNARYTSDTITQLVTMALMDLRGNYFRDNFFDVLGMVPDQPSAVYGRLSFGPGQRYASKGCYIVQITSGPDPELIRKSNWVIH
jgi:aryl carrier-like protein